LEAGAALLLLFWLSGAGCFGANICASGLSSSLLLSSAIVLTQHVGGEA
jgi:hypothetical protein